MPEVRVLILRTAGTNCDRETAEALRKAGSQPEIVHINAMIARNNLLDQYQMMVLPGGFSYGDDVGAGKILANELRFKAGLALNRFIASGRLVIGICNGFQALTKAGYLPDGLGAEQTVTLTTNDSGRFQCHWTRLRREKSVCSWLGQTEEHWDLPIAHGEGKFVAQDVQALKTLERQGQVVFRYHPENPNGSVHSIAGLCNPQGNVVGLMPHPERYVTYAQHPEWARGKENTKTEPVGLQFFRAAVHFAQNLS